MCLVCSTPGLSPGQILVLVPSLSDSDFEYYFMAHIPEHKFLLSYSKLTAILSFGQFLALFSLDLSTGPAPAKQKHCQPLYGH